MSSHSAPALWSLAAAMLWSVLAVNNPTVTYHVAPSVVALAWILAMDSPTAQQLLAAAVGGLVVALGTTVVLSMADALRGPDLAGGHAAAIEALAFAAASSFVGWAARSRGIRQAA